jgi:membrane protein
MIQILLASLWQAIRHWRRRHPDLVAGGLAYFTFFSLIPLLIILIVLISSVIELSRVKTYVFPQIESLFSQQTATLIEHMFRPALKTARTVTLLSSLILLWGATRVFSQLKKALDAIFSIHDAQPRSRIPHTILHQIKVFTATIGSILILLAFLLLDITLATLKRVSIRYDWDVPFRVLWSVWNYSASFVVFTIFFAMLFKLLPHAKIPWRSAWVGAAFSSTLYVLGRYLLSQYFFFGNIASFFGAAGSIVAVLLWIYFSALALLLGAEFTWAFTLKTTTEK